MVSVRCYWNGLDQSELHGGWLRRKGKHMQIVIQSYNHTILVIQSTHPDRGQCICKHLHHGVGQRAEVRLHLVGVAGDRVELVDLPVARPANPAGPGGVSVMLLERATPPGPTAVQFVPIDGPGGRGAVRFDQEDIAD